MQRRMLEQQIHYCCYSLCLCPVGLHVACRPEQSQYWLTKLLLAVVLLLHEVPSPYSPVS
jgi:hypothetical protein